MPQRAAPPLYPDCTGVLLAGGRGRRMGGAPKGLLRLGGEPIAARTLRLFAELFPRALIVAGDAAGYRELGAPVIGDALAGKGAPGGLHAALAAVTTPWLFLAACDMPFLSAPPIALLASLREGTRAVAPTWRGRLEPLHAFWSRAALPEVERLLRQGEPSLWQLATAVGARLVSEEAWREVDPEGRALENVNTPEDAARLGLAPAP